MQFVQSHPAFNDTIDSLKHEFREDMSNDVIICGAHDLSHTQSIDDYKRKYGKVIGFQPGTIACKATELHAHRILRLAVHGRRGLGL